MSRLQRKENHRKFTSFSLFRFCLILASLCVIWRSICVFVVPRVGTVVCDRFILFIPFVFNQCLILNWFLSFEFCFNWKCLFLKHENIECRTNSALFRIDCITWFKWRYCLLTISWFVLSFYSDHNDLVWPNTKRQTMKNGIYLKMDLKFNIWISLVCVWMFYIL